MAPISNNLEFTDDIQKYRVVNKNYFWKPRVPRTIRSIHGPRNCF